MSSSSSSSSSSQNIQSITLEQVSQQFQPSDTANTSQNIMATSEQGDLLLWTPDQRLLYVHMRMLAAKQKGSMGGLDTQDVSQLSLEDNEMVTELVCDPPIDFRVHSLRLNLSETHLVVYGDHNVNVVQLPYKSQKGLFVSNSQAKDERYIVCSAWSVADWDSTSKKIVNVEWHPMSEVHVAVLFSDGFLRLYNLEQDPDHAEQSFNLCVNRRFNENKEESESSSPEYIPHMEFTDSPWHNDANYDLVKPRMFCFREMNTGGDGIEMLTVHVLMADSSVWAVCPVLPFSW
eukprot:TRINITY_DN1864_c0_g1_i2.p1 TRINITY_DN1864_c0_g1~~TRINITY_DN1864_c0_g1_i2.p1  ORF type:complete len:300 (-),score=84.71 TRINITY_DN1864_c0_g1_i2:649-1518(-)